jgi:hypothetical protein
MDRLKAMDYTGADVPFLVILGSLKNLGWKPSTTENAAITLTTSVPNFFSNTMFLKRVKPYFQCLHFLPQLFGRGLERLLHTQSAAYYSAVLRAPRPADVPEGKPSTEYKEMAEDAKPKFDAGLALDDGFICSDCEQSSVAHSGKDESESDVSLNANSGGDGVAPAPNTPRRGSIAGFIGSGDDDTNNSSDSLSESSSISDQDDVQPSDVPYHSVYTLGGVRVTLDVFKHKREESRSHIRFKIVCRGCEHGANCTRRRSVSTSHTCRLGRLEPIAFLFAWWRLGASSSSKATHGFTTPTLEQVDVAWQDLHHCGVF